LARALKYFIQFSAVGTIYFFLVRSCLELASIYPGGSAIWPPAGFALAAVLLGGYRMVAAIFVASFVENAIASGPSYATAVMPTH
jgi:integral membrane sensor domain MASE1